ncbi:MAG: hypothetical protein NXI23_23140 [Bacteroidetes bacterium]|nr:hypothetical protein [Bacteroidota bacterium]MDF1867746.1 hypothetical protein [Saprospiraceae bacterium]
MQKPPFIILINGGFYIYSITICFAYPLFSFSFESTIMEKAIANKRLMNEFIQTMEADIAATKVELASYGV